MKFLKIVCGLMLLILLTSCNKEEMKDTDGNLPACILAEIDADDDLIVKTQTLNGEVHYWLNTGDLAFDGEEEIVNDLCEKVCYFGGWTNPTCIADYDPNEWQEAWPE